MDTCSPAQPTAGPGHRTPQLHPAPGQQVQYRCGAECRLLAMFALPVTLYTVCCILCRVAMTHSQHSCWYRPRYLVFVGDNMILFLQNAVGLLPQSMPCSHLLREILVEIIYFTLPLHYNVEDFNELS